MRGPWERIKPQAYYSASDFEKVLWACGIPNRFWNTREESIQPSAFKYGSGKSRESLSASIQSKYLKARLKDPELMRANRFVCITSSPSDDYALSAACLLATATVSKAWKAGTLPRVRVDDIQDYEKSLELKRDFYSASPELLILYNLSPVSSSSRLSLARDLMNSFEGTYRVVVAAAENPFKFARESLYMEPHEVYHFEGKPQKVIQI
jgi:hypothetical protein